MFFSSLTNELNIIIGFINRIARIQNFPYYANNSCHEKLQK